MQKDKLQKTDYSNYTLDELKANLDSLSTPTENPTEVEESSGKNPMVLIKDKTTLERVPPVIKPVGLQEVEDELREKFTVNFGNNLEEYYTFLMLDIAPQYLALKSSIVDTVEALSIITEDTHFTMSSRELSSLFEKMLKIKIIDKFSDSLGINEESKDKFITAYIGSLFKNTFKEKDT